MKTHKFKNIWEDRKYRIRWWFKYTKPFSYINDVYWWVRYRTTDKFHILNLESLKPGYHENDEVLLHACFQVLVNYVEKELGGLEHLDWCMTLTNKCDDQGNNIPESGLQINIEGTQGWCAKEKKELYLWWKNDYSKERKQLYKRWSIEEDKIFNKRVEQQLIRLMKIRTSIWT